MRSNSSASSSLQLSRPTGWSSFAAISPHISSGTVDLIAEIMPGPLACSEREPARPTIPSGFGHPRPSASNRGRQRSFLARREGATVEDGEGL